MRRIAMLVTALALALPCFAAPGLRSISAAEAGFLPGSGLRTASFDEALILGLSGPVSPCASFHVETWANGDALYKPGLGLAFDFGGGYYIDAWYYLAVTVSGGSAPGFRHSASAALNLELGGLYAALRETVDVSAEAASFLTTASLGWTFSGGSSLFGNAALALERGAAPAPALWGEGSWRVLPWLDLALGGAAEWSADGFEGHVGAGPSFYTGKLTVDLRGRRRFGVYEGLWCLAVLVDVHA